MVGVLGGWLHGGEWLFGEFSLDGGWFFRFIQISE